MEVSVEDFPGFVDTVLVEADVHRWRSLLGHDVDGVGFLAFGRFSRIDWVVGDVDAFSTVSATMLGAACLTHAKRTVRLVWEI